MTKSLLVTLTLFIYACSSMAQNKQLKVNYFYPKDSIRFEQATDLPYNYDMKESGKTTMIIQCECDWGCFEFIFKKKIHKIEHFGGNYSDVYGVKKDGSFGVVRKDYNTPYTLSEHDLFAYVLLHDHGGFLTKMEFKDFGNEVYWPEFDYTNCSVSDEDKDGKPEFYLSYMGDSDGLDAKPYKQIVYTIPENPKGKALTKAKATAYYPAGNDEDVYHIEYDANWKILPQTLKAKSQKIMLVHKKKYEKE